MFLLINNSASKYADKYQLFEDELKAIKKFKKLTGDSYPMTISNKIGTMNSVTTDRLYFDVGLINLEINKEICQ